MEQTISSASPRRNVFWRIAGFALVFATLQLTWQRLDEGPWGRLVIDEGTVRPAAFVIDLVTPGVGVRAVGDSLIPASGRGLRIMNGCEGIEVVFLLLAAFVVAPLPLISRWRAILGGMPLFFFANQLRILALFYANRSSDRLFDELHAIIAPIFLILLACWYFYAWLAQADRRAVPSA